MIKAQPFFILANPRSGSSLLRIICESHSNITVPPESGFLEWWYGKYKNWNILYSQSISKIEEFCEDLKSSKKFETYKFDFDFFKFYVIKEQPVNYSELISLVYISFGIKSDKNVLVWGDKNNYYLDKTKLLFQLYPNAKYIHLVRDGRDVATSYKALKKMKSSSSYAPKLTSDIEKIANEWNNNNNKLINFFKSVSSKNVLVIRYEDLINDLKKECQRITSFLNVPFDENMLSYYSINKFKGLEPVETLDWKKKTLEKLDPSNIGKYKQLLSKDDIVVFNNIAKGCLETFNYEY